MLRDKKFITAISVAVILIVLIGVFRPREIDWTPSFLSEDKIPYGTYILYNSLPDIFVQDSISINTKSMHSLLHKKSFSNSTLLFVQSSFEPTIKERKDILGFASAGNNVFISSGHISHGFADVLNITEERGLFDEVMANAKNKDKASFSQANFTNPRLHSDSAYVFSKDFYSASYAIRDSAEQKQTSTSGDTAHEVTVLGVDAANNPTFIRVGYGKGYVFIHNNPYAFTNYYMLKPRGGEYAAKCLSYLPQGRIMLDESGRRDETLEKTPLNFILSRESLRWAYFTAMAFLLLYVLFNVKRRQRIIPLIDPFKNTSLEFTQTVGSLYFNQSNHKNIAKKKITYFLEFIRNRYNIDTAVLDVEFARKLCYKSGLSESAIEHLMNIMAGIAKKTRIPDTELIDLNHSMEYFKRNCQ